MKKISDNNQIQDNLHYLICLQLFIEYQVLEKHINIERIVH